MSQWHRVFAKFLTGGLAWLAITAYAGESQFSISIINVEANPHPLVESGIVIQHCCFSPAEMDQIVRRYVRTTKVQFDFGTAHAKVFIPRTTNYMACVWYAPGKDKPALLCIGFQRSSPQIEHRARSPNS